MVANSQHFPMLIFATKSICDAQEGIHDSALGPQDYIYRLAEEGWANGWSGGG